MASSAVLAHVSGVPVEEVVALAFTAGGMATTAARTAWIRLSRRRG
jgi:branched-subunit amino acid ABC-type transport system permease component